jgi:hypothetical protein
LLASYLAASRLLSTDDSVFFDIDCAEGPFSDDELATLVRHAIRQVALNEHLDSFEGRLHRPVWESNGEQTGLSKTSLGETLVSEVWYVSGGHRWPSSLSALLRILPQLGATELNYVRYAYAVGDPEEAAATERNVIEQCEANGVGFRIFRVSLIIGPNPPLKGPDREGFLQFLWNVHDLKREIEERRPEYFEYQSLRCLAKVDASLNLIRVDQAAEMMLDLARRPSTIRRSYNIGGPENIPFADICECWKGER